ncbi:ABC transporter C family member 8-like protein isoform X1 [Tanacetum coccineum]
MQDRFFKDYLKLVDTDASTFIFSNATLEWLILRTEAFTNVTLITAAFLLVSIPNGFASPGLVGLSLSYALALSGTQVFFTRWYCSLANYIVSVERIKQFMHIPPEPPTIVEDNNHHHLSFPTGRVIATDSVIPTDSVIATDSVIVASSGYVVPAAYDISLGRVK